MEDNKELTIDELLKKLDDQIEKMQSEDLSLEQTFALYKAGLSLIEECNNRIEKIQCDIKVLNTDLGDING